jgi:hypothetical protein
MFVELTPKIIHCLVLYLTVYAKNKPSIFDGISSKKYILDSVEEFTASSLQEVHEEFFFGKPKATFKTMTNNNTFITNVVKWSTREAHK